MGIQDNQIQNGQDERRRDRAYVSMDVFNKESEAEIHGVLLRGNERNEDEHQDVEAGVRRSEVEWSEMR